MVINEAPYQVLAPQPQKNCCKACCEASAWLGNKLRRFSRLTQYGLVAINGVYLWRRIVNTQNGVDEKTLDNIEVNCLTALDFIGLGFVFYSVDYTYKTLADVYSGFKKSHKIVMICATARAVELISNLIQLAISTAAAVEAQKENFDKMDELYSSIQIWGVATVALGIFNSFCYFLMGRQALKILENQQKEQPDLIQGFRKGDSPDTAVIELIMDKDTLRLFKKMLNEDEERTSVNGFEIEDRDKQLLEIIQKNLKVQKNVDFCGDFSLELMGAGFLAYSKYKKPTSLSSAFINLIFSILYALKYTWEAIKEALQRNALQNIHREIQVNA
jgi:hypothetical protein